MRAAYRTILPSVTMAAAATASPVLTVDPAVRQLMTRYYTEEAFEETLRRIAVPPSYSTLRVNTLRVTREELVRACAPDARPCWPDMHNVAFAD